MRSQQAINPVMCTYGTPSMTLLQSDHIPPHSLAHAGSNPELPTTLSAPKMPGVSDTGVEFLTLYRTLMADIEGWCKPGSGPITQVIRWQALRDYVELYCHTYPRQPSYPFPPRFGRYAAYLDGFDDIVEAIDAWCEWLSRCFLPGVMPIDLIRSALEEWEENHRVTDLTHARPYMLKTMK